MTNTRIQCEKLLQTLGIDYKSNYTIPGVPSYVYNFYFQVNGVTYVLDLDYEWHLKFPNILNSVNREHFEALRTKNANKTIVASVLGYKIIRIDYTQFNNVESHLKDALDYPDQIYFSTPALYKWICERLNDELEI